MINYIAAFLTLRCNLNCSYCINRQGSFKVPDEMSGEDWIKGLSRLKTRQDLPISLQGGEPTMHPDFYKIVEGVFDKELDLLTNGTFDVHEFMAMIPANVFQRNAPYASIRFSFHKGMDALALVQKVYVMKAQKYEVGIWGLDRDDMIPDNHLMRDLCKEYGIDFRMKEYLDDKHGTYKYPEGLNGKHRKVLCKTTEILIGPSGHIYRCHADLYNNSNPIGHILDKSLPSLDYRPCDTFGSCNPCDVKLKTNRLQEYGHCSVEIKC